MAGSLSITIGADATQLRAQLAVAQSELRAFTREMNAAANAARRSGEDLALAKVGQAAAMVNRATSEIAKLKEELGGTESLAKRLSAAFTNSSAAIREPLDALAMMRSGLRETAEIAGIMFAVDRVKEWALEMAESGERAVNLSAALGISVGQFVELQGVMRLAGGNAEEASRAMERLARSVGEAMRNPVAQQREAFRVLGISMAEVQAHGNNLKEMLSLLVKSYGETNNSIAKTAAFEELIGRGYERLIPLLRQGTEGAKENTAKFKELDAAGERAATAGASVAEEFHKLAVATKGVSDELFVDLAPAFKEVLSDVADFTGEIRQLIAAANDLAKPIGGLAGGLKIISQAAVNAIPGVGLFTRAYSAIRGATPKEEPVATAELPPLDITAKRDVPWMGQLKAGNPGADLSAEMRLRIAEAGEDTAKIEGIWQEWLQKLSALYGEDSRQYRQVAVEKLRWEKQAQQQGFELRMSDASAQQRIDGLNLAAFTRNREAEVAAKRLTTSEAITADLQYTSQLYAQERARLEDIMENTAQAKAQKLKLYEDLMTLDAQYTAKLSDDMKKLAEAAKKTAEAWAAPFKKAFDQLGSTFESALSGLLDHSKTMRQTWLDIEKSVTNSAVNLAGSVASKGAASLLGATAGQGLGDFLGDKLLSSIGLGSQTAALQATANGLLTEIAANTAAMVGSSGTSAVGSAAGSAAGSGGGGLFGWLTGTGGILGSQGPLFGTAADASIASGGPPLALAAAALARGGIVPAAAGGWALPSSFGTDSILSALTPGEMVLPRHISEGIQGALAGGGLGGGDVHVHLPVAFHGPTDAASVGRWFDNNMPHIIRQLQRGLRSNVVTPRTV